MPNRFRAKSLRVKTGRMKRVAKDVQAMASGTEVLEFEQLLRPISESSPCGESLRWDPAWSELADLRKTRKDPIDPSADKMPD